MKNTMIGKFFRDRSRDKEDKSKEDQSNKDQRMERCGGMRDIINKIVKAIVDSPDDVNISEIDGGRTTIIELKVAKDDIGKVIGKKGRTISAIRTLLASAGGKEKIRYVLELLED
jgi:hypothetical protein